MASYQVALVRFEGRGKSYPVNGHEIYQPGDSVVVEMNWECRQELVKAVVVGRSSSRRPCRHSIVCSEDVAEDYGQGPAGIQTRSDLDRYMRHMHCAPVEVVSCDHDGLLLGNQSWSLAYLSSFTPPHSRPFEEGQKWLTLFDHLYVLGPAGIGVCETWNGRQIVRVLGQKIGITANKAKIIYHLQDNIYRRFAETFKGSLIHEVEAHESDTTLRQIRSAIGGDDSGSVYLSDDIWL